jgi:GT2 family glycosyltransferase
MNLKKICDKHHFLDYKEFVDHINKPTPIITICMVSYRRYTTLINTLKQYIKLDTPINLILWLNDSDSVPSNTMKQINDLCKNLYSYDIIYSKENVGTGKSRNVMISKAYNDYDTPYIMTTDDDIVFNSKEELLVGSYLLGKSEFQEYGAMGIWCNPSFMVVSVGDEYITNELPIKGFQDTDALGAATMTIRKDVIDTCNVDGEYIIGWVDWDFGMTIRHNGWKLGLLCEDEWKPFNNKIEETTDKIYSRNRRNRTTHKNSTERFKSKWGVIPKWERKWPVS